MQFPEIRRGTILPRSVKKFRRSPASLKSIGAFSRQNLQGRLRWNNRPPPRSLSLRSIDCLLIILVRLTLFTHIIAGVVVHRRFRTRPTVLTLGHERHSLGDHFVFAPLLSILSLPSAVLQPTFDDRPVAFTKILPAMLRLSAEHDDIDEADFFLQVFTLFKPTAHRQAETRHRCPARS